MPLAIKKPDDGGTSNPAEANLYRNNTTKEQIVSMLERLLLCCGEDVVTLEPETIKVTFLGGSVRYANVYADSHLAICRDVLNQVFV